MESLKCTNCGVPIVQNTRFCLGCGVRLTGQNQPQAVQPNSNSNLQPQVVTCIQCGYQLSTATKFCLKCGLPTSTYPPIPATQMNSAFVPPVDLNAKSSYAAGVTPNAGPSTMPLPSENVMHQKSGHMKTGTAGNKNKLVLGIGLITIVLVAGIWFVLNYTGLLSDINTNFSSNTGSNLAGVENDDKEFSSSITDNNSNNLSNESSGSLLDMKRVSSEVTNTDIAGVHFDFGPYNLDKENELYVERLAINEMDGSELTFTQYNILMENVQEFPVLVKITLPYVGDNIPEDKEKFCISVRYFNPETGIWEEYPSVVDSDSDTVTFYTDHFSSYGVFNDKAGLLENDEVISLFSYVGPYRGPNTPVYTTRNRINKMSMKINDAAFRSMLNSKGETQKVLSDPASNLALGLADDVVSGSEFFFTPTELQNTYSNYTAKLGKAFGTLGIVTTFSKIGYQWYSGDSASTIIWDNITNLGGAVASGAAYAYAAPSLSLVATGFWAAGLLQYLPDIPVVEPMDDIERAYRDFNNINLKYLNKSKQWIYWREQTDTSYVDYNADYTKDPSFTGSHAWVTIFNDIQKRFPNDPKSMAKAVEGSIDQYCDVFWATNGAEILRYVSEIETGTIIKGSLADDWIWPDEEQVNLYKAHAKAALIKDLQPLFKAMSDKSYEQLQREILQQVLEIWPLLNEEFSFEIEDPGAPTGYFGSSEYADYEIRFEDMDLFATDTGWEGKKPDNTESSIVFNCNLYGLLKVGSPDKLVLYANKTDADNSVRPLELPFELTSPITVVTIPETKFLINILPGNNLKGKAMYELQIQAVPAKKEQTFKGLTLRWTSVGSSDMSAIDDKLNFSYDNEGQYEILVEAINDQKTIVGEGRATIQIIKADEELPVQTPTATPKQSASTGDEAEGRSGSFIGKYDSGLTLAYEITGGRVLGSENEGYTSRLYMSGTIHEGETLSIQASGTATNFNDKEIIEYDTLLYCKVYVDGNELGRDEMKLKPGGGGSVSISVVVPKGSREVSINCSASTQWKGNYGASASDMLATSLICKVVK